ncbi:polysaccharide biosynthesis tyrosine autokinase [Pigmentiphaga sp. H8]|uniref:polysaccharide biosynthesis tyrosine autokinase n=1 Tax=Pigmentiphaga sp. H8 TaxID=2488560 RepID=UPI000F5A3E8B|nr:polysaccharide biosynthesis tyrosine autokinase [Pigmentiphaga sp. H8]AZG07259.1 polysaccharide biosynthesis tyrosine autokinase [Pigmentiphaga sp. H8]
MKETNFAALNDAELVPADQINLADVIDTLLQHIWIICVFAFAAIVIGVAYAVLATPIYQADALVQVEDKKSSALLGGLENIADALGANSSPVSGEVEILRSREVIVKAIVATHADVSVEPKYFPLFGRWWSRHHSEEGAPVDPLFGLTSYAWGGERLVINSFSIPESRYGQDFIFRVTDKGYQIEDQDGVKVAAGSAGEIVSFPLDGKASTVSVKTLIGRPGTEFVVSRRSTVDVYRDVLQGLSVAEVGKQSSVIRVSYTDPDVDFARGLVNAIARAYLTQNVERRSAEADQSLKFLEEQLPQIKQSVIRAEDALNAFRTKTNTVSVEKATDSLLQQAVETEKERMQLQLKRDELRQRYRPEHPELKAIESQLAAINRESGTINDQVNRLPAAQRDLLRLQRDAEVGNELYVALLNNAQQLRVAKAGTVGNVRIIDFAVRDTLPVAPRKALIVGVAALFGLMLGIAAAFVVRMLRPTVREVSEVERATGLVSFASIPESISQEKLDSSKRDRKGRDAIVSGRSQLLAVMQPDDPAIESLRSLRTGLSFATLGAENKSIVITGPTSALGKSFVSANLSALLASAGKRVLLIETDMRRPQLGTYFGYELRAGLSNLLAGQKRLDDVLITNAASIDGLDVLPSGQIPPNPGELLLTEAFAQLLSNVQPLYDHILLDSAPILPVGDTLAVASQASTVLMVVRSEVSTLGEVRDAVRKLETTGTRVKGVIFNGIKRRRVGYGYAYRYYYGYGNKA